MRALENFKQVACLSLRDVFGVDMDQWRAMIRRMLRYCKVAVALPNDACPAKWSGGALVVEKDKICDRFICGWRSQNSQETSVGRVLLLFGPRFRRLFDRCIISSSPS